MRVVIPQIAWHARDPVLTLDFDPRGKTEGGYYRLASGGADRLLLIWHLSNASSLKPEITPVAELTRHQKGINVVRFSPCGNYIASGDDDSYVFIWKCESVEEKEEVWNVEKILRRHVEDVTDLCWSPDSNFIVSGSVDNTAVLWDVKKGTPVHFWSEREHTGFVQGVTYDPLGEFSATMCIDRNLRFFNNKNGKVLSKTLKYPGAWLGYSEEEESKENGPEVTISQEGDTTKPDVKTKEESNDSLVETSAKTESTTVTDQNDASATNDEASDATKPLTEINGDEQVTKFPLPPKRPATTLNRLFHDDSLKTFCRRISCSPRGELMIVPGGLLPPVEKNVEGSETPARSRQSTPVNGEELPEAKSNGTGSQSAPADKEKKESDDTENKENEKEEVKEKEKSKRFDPDQQNAVVLFCRNSWSNPCAVIPTGLSYSIAARFSPKYYTRDRETYEYDPEFANSSKRNERVISCIGKLRAPRPEAPVLLDMPYRLVYAVATNDCLLIGDTCSIEPLACLRNIHCTRMTDISWSPDGLVLVASSTDGFCSITTFEEGELGSEFKVAEGESFPTLTPTAFPIAPPEPKPVKVKEPKPPKEPKTPKEPKEPKEKKEKEPKEKKEKKEPTTPNVTKDDKKPKQKSVMELLNSAKKTATGSQRTPKVDTIKPQETEGQSEGTSPSQNASPAPKPATPKPTFLESWVKKTPKSEGFTAKPPRRIQLNTLTPQGTSQASSNQAKQPRRIPLITLGKDGSTAKKQAVEVPADQTGNVPIITLDADEPAAKRQAVEAPADQTGNIPSQPIPVPVLPTTSNGPVNSRASSSASVAPKEIKRIQPIPVPASSPSSSMQKAPRRITPLTLVSSPSFSKKESSANATQFSSNENPVEAVISKLAVRAEKEQKDSAAASEKPSTE